MASGREPLNVDLAGLLKPISEGLPAGESLRRSLIYDQIKEARREDDPTLEQGVWVTESKRADWVKVAELSLDALATRSKDLRLCGWLTEAWLKLHGAVGAEQGLRLIESLANRFWDTLYPLIEDGDVEPRMAPIAWLNDTLARQIKALPLTKPETREPQIFTWQDWERASASERGRKPAADDLTASQFMACVMLTPVSFYSTLEAELGHLWEAAVDLEVVLDKRRGKPVAALRAFKEALSAIREFTARAIDQKSENEPMSAATVAVMGASEDNVVGAGVRWGPIRNRAEAYQRLSEVADYLMRTDPHSPTPHLIRRAVNWGNMTFTDLVEELVSQQDRRAILALLGLKVPGA